MDLGRWISRNEEFPGRDGAYEREVVIGLGTLG
jgi:hypothetical protein